MWSPNPICGRPGATDIFLYCPRLFGEVAEIINKEFVNFFDIQNTMQHLLCVVPLVFPPWQRPFHSAGFHPTGSKDVLKGK